MRLESISICNYKSIDYTRILFHRPRTVHIRDVFVLGGPQGAGKTSVLEAICIGLIENAIPSLRTSKQWERTRVSTKQDIDCGIDWSGFCVPEESRFLFDIDDTVNRINGFTPACLSTPAVVYAHANRFVEASMLGLWTKELLASTEAIAGVVQIVLGGIGAGYHPGAARAAILNLLYLIWTASKDSPVIVLLDEPELHLDDEFRHRVVGLLTDAMPENQYIVATNSEDVYFSLTAAAGSLYLTDNVPADPRGAETHRVERAIRRRRFQR